MRAGDVHVRFRIPSSRFPFPGAGVGMYRLRKADFGFRVSGFGFRVSDFGSRDSGFGFQVSDFGLREYRVCKLAGTLGHPVVLPQKELLCDVLV